MHRQNVETRHDGRDHQLRFVVAVFIVSGIFLPEVLGFIRADYRSTANYISELGATGADYAVIAKYIGFLPVALAAVLMLIWFPRRYRVNRASRIGIVLWFLGLSIGYLSAVAFPCDYGCPPKGSTSQNIHNLAAIVTYPVSLLGLSVLSFGLFRARMRVDATCIGVAALLSTLGFIMLLAQEQMSVRGAWQRLTEYSIFLLVWFLVVVRNRTPTHNLICGEQ